MEILDRQQTPEILNSIDLPNELKEQLARFCDGIIKAEEVAITILIMSRYILDLADRKSLLDNTEIYIQAYVEAYKTDQNIKKLITQVMFAIASNPVSIDESDELTQRLQNLVITIN